MDNGALKISRVSFKMTTHWRAGNCRKQLRTQLFGWKPSTTAQHVAWSEIKAENFVVAKDSISVKGIDLESAVPVKENPLD